MTKARTACAVMLFSIAATGCLSQQPPLPVRYYSIDTHPLATKKFPPANARLGIRAFMSASRFRDKILKRTSDYQLEFYEDERWIEPPEEMVSRAFRSAFASCGMFEQVVPAEEIRPPAYMLEGELVSFEMVERPEGSLAECALDLRLRDADTWAIIWSGEVRSQKQLVNKDIPSLVSAMSDAAMDAATQAIDKISKLNLAPPAGREPPAAKK
ncbi:MAG TPA: ABC-type transport auxiliary lipoprotein family protein [Candidatus Brocadiia bacterium]|nr:ABC-type transport auxiliary lipoprotein family protein [Candidatus Brocadiia bacterium]